MCVWQARGVRKVSPAYFQALESIRAQAAVEQPTALRAGLDISTGIDGMSPLVARPQKRLVFVFSFWLPKWKQVATNLHGWHAHGEPCSGKATPFMSLVMAPAFDSNTNISSIISVQRSLDPLIERFAGRCFRSVEWYTKANLTWPDSQYPQAPTVQFFQLIFDAYLRARFDVMWLMEQDISPIRSFFLDALYQEALWPVSFWLKGTSNRGIPSYDKEPTGNRLSNDSMLSQPAWVERNKDWIGHINGAALYGLNYPLFDAMLRAAEILFKLKPYIPWDAILEIVLHDVPNECLVASGEFSALCAVRGESGPTKRTFPITQLINTHVYRTDFVWNVGRTIGKPEVSDAARAAGTYLLHGRAVGAPRDKRRASSRTLRSEGLAHRASSSHGPG